MYLTRDDRTGILLELIADAIKSMGATPTDSDYIPKSEKDANRLGVAFSMIVLAAKRHPDWLKEEPVVPPPAKVPLPQTAEVHPDDIPF